MVSRLWAELSPAELTALGLSVRIGVWSVVGGLPLAFVLAYLLARGSFYGKALLDAVVHLPLVLPPVVTGFALLLAFGRNGPVGAWLADWFGVSVMFRWTGAAIAAALMALPLMVRPIRLSLGGVDRRLEVAARTLGATPFHAFRTVTLPLAMPGIIAGGVLGFARSIGEFGATVTFVSNIPGETQTLPMVIYGALQVPGGDAAAARLSVVAVVLSLAALLASDWLSRRVSHERRLHVV